MRINPYKLICGGDGGAESLVTGLSLLPPEGDPVVVLVRNPALPVAVALAHAAVGAHAALDTRLDAQLLQGSFDFK